MTDAYRQSLETHGLEDVQPAYRKLLVSLKSLDPAAYERAVSRYRDDVESADDEVDPLGVWVTYGRWLAEQVAPGTLKAIDRNGLARDAGEPAPLGDLLIHLPDDAKRRGLVVAMPTRPSDAQRETVGLLCE